MTTVATYTAQPLLIAARSTLGEGPVWDHRTNRLSWVDIVNCELNILDATTNELSVFRVPSDCGVSFLTFAIPCGPTQQAENAPPLLAPGAGANAVKVVAEGAFTVPAMSACTDTFVCGSEKGLFLWRPFGTNDNHSDDATTSSIEKKPTTTKTSTAARRVGKVLALSPLLAPQHQQVKASSNTTSTPALLAGNCAASKSSLAPLAKGVRTNDAKVDGCGRLFYGTMDIAEQQPKGELFRVATTTSTYPCTSHAFHAESLIQSEGKFTISNGIDWSPTHDVMYTIDSPTQRVFASRYDAERGMPLPQSRKVFFQTPEGTYPDGMCVDEEGFLWVALWNGGKVLRVHPQTGKVVAEVIVPGCKRVTSVCFGGPRLSQLFITTAVGNKKDSIPDEGEAENAGRVFVAHVGACGLPMNAFPLPLRVAVQFCDLSYQNAVFSSKL